jgi:hypothetical protein
LVRRIKALRTDGGGEFCSTDFHTILCDNGIARQRTPRDTPQQHKNGASGVLVSAYVRNRCSTRALLNMTPFEAWTGQKPSLSNLRLFGCCAYVHALAKNRSKLDAKAVRCVFIGYPAESKAYLLWNPQTGKTILSPATSTLLTITRPVTGADGGGQRPTISQHQFHQFHIHRRGKAPVSISSGSDNISSNPGVIHPQH